MDVLSISYRYDLVRAEIRQRLTPSGKWLGLPGLLDELDSLRIEYRMAQEDVRLLPRGSMKPARQQPPDAKRMMAAGANSLQSCR
jgi:hypothetical protein